MWTFTQRGFVSVVAYDPTKDKKSDSPFPKIAKQAGTHLLVRARIKADLDQLKRVVPSLVIDTDASADYAYRAVITRGQYKKFICEEVDQIDYDSHFKEAARDNSPKAEGRYSAMMSVWSAMARLQEIRPWSGGNRGWTSTYGKGKNESTSGNPILTDFEQSLWDDLVNEEAASTAAPEPKGAPTVEDFLADPGYYGGASAWRGGRGPRTGYKAGDVVWGYAGRSVVSEVTQRKGKSDVVKVKTPSKVNKGSETTGSYVSNYLVPDLTDWLQGEGRANGDIDLDKAYDLILNERSAKVDTEVLTRLDDNAFELVTRMQERSDTYSSTLLDEIYSEIRWEIADGDEKRKIASEGVVPTKYEAEGIRILNEVAAEVSGDAAGA
jgi:hypothetical protein